MVSKLNLNITDQAWTQAQLPSRLGGLGLRSATGLAHAAFLSSLNSTKSAIGELIPTDDALAYEQDALNEWSNGGFSLPKPDAFPDQDAWDAIACSVARSSIAISTEEDRIRLDAASSSNSGAWLNAIPSELIGTILEDTVFRTAIGYRLGIDFVGQTQCVCGITLDSRGLHALACKKLSGPKIARHADICDILSRAIRQGGFPCRLEPQGLSLQDRSRPDGETLRPWRNGKALTFDVTVWDSFCPSNRSDARKGPGFVAKKAEVVKSLKYAHLNDTHIFVPFALESTGAWGKEASILTKEIARHIKDNCGEGRALEFLR